MDFIDCPLCGKPNPAENKFCDFCLGHLEPPGPTSADSSSQSISRTEDSSRAKGETLGEADIPDWLKEIQGEDERDVSQSSESGSAPGISGESDAGYSIEAPGDDSAGGAFGGFQMPESSAVSKPFFSEQDLPIPQEDPDWLDKALTEQPSQEVAADEALLDQQSTVADAGGVGEAGPADTGGQARRASRSVGPLAGLKGTLSAEPGVTQIRKSAAFSTQLHVTEKQSEHVQLLESMLADEGQPQPLPKKAPITQQNVFRWAIGLILLVVILWPIIVDSQQMPLPPPSEGGAEVNRLITQLPENAKVLVGFDYEPGLAEELEAAAAPVIDHLMLRGSLLTLVSTSPNGSILAERMVQSLSAEDQFTSGSNYVNLGYIPGGAAGLRSFAENPAGILPLSIDDQPVWGSDESQTAPPLEGIDQLTDFDMLVLLADDPNIARSWFEQVGSIISGPQVLTSFIAITSAQLEPLVHPYFSSSPQFVNGMVTGLRGGAAYTRLTGGENIVLKYWDAFGMGTFTAAMLILVGGLGYYVLPQLARLGEPESKGE